MIKLGYLLYYFDVRVLYYQLYGNLYWFIKLFIGFLYQYTLIMSLGILLNFRVKYCRLLMLIHWYFFLLIYNVFFLLHNLFYNLHKCAQEFYQLLDLLDMILYFWIIKSMYIDSRRLLIQVYLYLWI